MLSFNNTKGLHRIPELQLILMAASVAVSLAVLVYASWRDYVCREVSNKVWVVYAPIALALTLTELVLYEPSSLPWYGLSVGVSVVIALLLFYIIGVSIFSPVQLIRGGIMLIVYLIPYLWPPESTI